MSLDIAPFAPNAARVQIFLQDASANEERV